MSARKPNPYQTRSARQRRLALIRTGVWVILALFLLSSVGIVFGVFVKP
jgi:hypothetical protein